MIDSTQMLPVGTTLRQGTYRVIRYMASGGFGNTYEVRHTGLGKRMALKEFFIRGINNRYGADVTVTDPTNADTFGKIRNNFFSEARRQANFDEPHIVEVTDSFEENQTAYYVMKYIEGQSLDAMLKSRRTPLSEREVMDVLYQVLSALAYVHNYHDEDGTLRPIYHLDLKPANIMRGTGGHCWLIDFGASRQITPDDRATLSTHTALCYTPGYAPVEQVTGSAKYIGPWTDFYALGATLYYLLTLSTPPDLGDVKRQKAAAFQFPGTVSPQMRQLIIWLMQYDETMRPQSTNDIYRRLSQPVSQEPLTVKNNRGRAVPPPVPGWVKSPTPPPIPVSSQPSSQPTPSFPPPVPSTPPPVPPTPYK